MDSEVAFLTHNKLDRSLASTAKNSNNALMGNASTHYKGSQINKYNFKTFPATRAMFIRTNLPASTDCIRTNVYILQ